MNDKDSLGRNRHPNQNNGSKPMGEAGGGNGGRNIVKPHWLTDPLNEYAGEAWDKAKAELERRDLLDDADAPLLEQFAEAWQTWAMARDDVTINGFTLACESDRGAQITKKNPAVEVMSDAWKRCRSLYADLGIGASARAKLNQGTTEADPLAAFLSSN